MSKRAFDAEAEEFGTMTLDQLAGPTAQEVEMRELFDRQHQRIMTGELELDGFELETDDPMAPDPEFCGEVANPIDLGINQQRLHERSLELRREAESVMRGEQQPQRRQPANADDQAWSEFATKFPELAGRRTEAFGIAEEVAKAGQFKSRDEFYSAVATKLTENDDDGRAVVASGGGATGKRAQSDDEGGDMLADLHRVQRGEGWY